MLLYDRTTFVAVPTITLIIRFVVPYLCLISEIFLGFSYFLSICHDFLIIRVFVYEEILSHI